MPSSIRLSILAVVLAFLSAAIPTPVVAQESTARGRLATVEPNHRRITIVPDGATEIIELFLEKDGAITRDDKTLSLRDLVLETGRRLTVRYRSDGARRMAQTIIVESTAR